MRCWGHRRNLNFHTHIYETFQHPGDNLCGTRSQRQGEIGDQYHPRDINLVMAPIHINNVKASQEACVPLALLKAIEVVINRRAQRVWTNNRSTLHDISDEPNLIRSGSDLRSGCRHCRRYWVNDDAEES